jgi:hypothetical protein
MLSAHPTPVTDEALAFASSSPEIPLSSYYSAAHKILRFSVIFNDKDSL